MTFLNIFSKKPIKKTPELNITVDHREKNSLLISELLSKNFKIEYKQLPVADYLINGIAIERKTLSDLKSSIINKRVFSQLLELKQYPQHFLLIEGPQEELYDSPLHENAMRGFLLAAALEFQTPIIFTKNAEDTSKYLSILAKQKPEKEIPLRPSKILLTEKEQIQFILEGFPNIGPVTIKKLLKEFKTLKDIINAPLEDLQQILGKKAESFKALIERKIKFP